MKLDDETFVPFIGGQLEAQDHRGQSLKRGEIAAVNMTGDLVAVIFSQCVRMENGKWVREQNLVHCIHTNLCDASVIPGRRLLIQLTSTTVKTASHSSIFYPKDSAMGLFDFSSVVAS